MLPEHGAGAYGLPGHSQRLINAANSDAEGHMMGDAAAPGAVGSPPGAARRRALIAGAAAGVLAVAVLCGVLAWAVPLVPGARPPLEVAYAAGAPLAAAGAAGRLDEAYCQRLSGLDLQQHCLEYLNAPGKRRFRVAVEWQRFDTESCEAQRGIGGGQEQAAA
jgi:hypothetical protein